MDSTALRRCIPVWLSVVALVLASSSATVVDIPSTDHVHDISTDAVECHGTRSNMGISYSGTQEYWYNDMVKTYTNCTHVVGNLIVSWLSESNMDFDFSCLSRIRYVAGYVFIGVVDYDGDILLPNLEIIRGNRTFLFEHQEYALAVVFTNVDAIRLPRLKEISRGKVLFTQNNPDMYIDVTRDWDSIVRGRIRSGTGSVVIEGNVLIAAPDVCSTFCPRRCFMGGYFGCCHNQCAGSCWGPAPNHCELCKDYILLGECVSYCPDDYYTMGQRCVPIPRITQLETTS